MNKAFGVIHSLVALLVLLYFCLGPLMGEAGSEYWELTSWVMFVTALFASYFAYQHHTGSDDDAAKRGLFFTLCMTLLVVHQTLSANAGGDVFGSDLWNITVVLYVVTTGALGNRLRSS
jgi:hypothetical protein